VRRFYKDEFWNVARLDHVIHQRTAESLFDFGVNAGMATAVRLAQIVVGTVADGISGPKTIAALNVADPERFSTMYALAKIARYRDIVTKDRSQLQFLLGWINRTLREAS
jgi:lysozyme family protein